MIYFTTIKCYDGDLYNLDYHERRISQTIGLNICLQEYIYPPSLELLKCKVLYDNSGILEVIFDKYIEKENKVFKIIYDDDINYKYKLLNRDDINLLFNKKESADDIIIIKNNLITDTSIANIAIFDNNHWITPKTPLLKGTFRDKLLDEQFLVQKDITIDQLLNCTKFAIMNAMVDFKVINDFKIML